MFFNCYHYLVPFTVQIKISCDFRYSWLFLTYYQQSDSKFYKNDIQFSSHSSFIFQTLNLYLVIFVDHEDQLLVKIKLIYCKDSELETPV